MTIFDLINNYQDYIVASVTLALGAVQTGVSSWAINRVINDEHFLIYIIGHVMYKKTKNLKEAIENYSSLKEFLRNDLFETLDIIKIGFSVALVAGICQSLASLLILCLRDKAQVRRLWFWVVGFSIIGLVTSFFLVLNYLVQNVLYFQVFLATTGINAFVLIHLIVAMLAEVYCGSPAIKPEETEESSIESGETGTTSTNSSHTTIDTTGDQTEESNNPPVDAETQTPSVAVSIQEEFPLPSPPPNPNNSNNIPASAVLPAAIFTVVS